MPRSLTYFAMAIAEPTYMQVLLDLMQHILFLNQFNWY